MQNNEQNSLLASQRKDLYNTKKFPLKINTLQDLLKIWPELEDITTEKQRIKSHFVLRDTHDCFKIYFYKSGYVKKVNDNNTQHLFLNNWVYNFLDDWDWRENDDFFLEVPKLEKYSIEILIDKAHKFMISKKILRNVDLFFLMLRDQKPKTPF